MGTKVVGGDKGGGWGQRWWVGTKVVGGDKGGG